MANTHENFRAHEQVKGSSDRSFGVVFTVVFLLIGLLPLRKGHAVRGWALALALLFAVMVLVRPTVLHPLNRAWTRLGLLLAKVVNPIVTGVLYFAVLTPFGTVMRLIGKDPLRLRMDANASSYWIERRPPGPPPESMANQF